MYGAPITIVTTCLITMALVIVLLVARPRLGARRLRQLGSAAATVVLVATVLDLVATTPSAQASSGSWFAYAGAATSGLTVCPQTTDTTQQCLLAEALSAVTPGGTIYLASNGGGYRRELDGGHPGDYGLIPGDASICSRGHGDLDRHQRRLNL